MLPVKLPAPHTLTFGRWGVVMVVVLVVVVVVVVLNLHTLFSAIVSWRLLPRARKNLDIFPMTNMESGGHARLEEFFFPGVGCWFFHSSSFLSFAMEVQEDHQLMVTMVYRLKNRLQGFACQIGLSLDDSRILSLMDDVRSMVRGACLGDEQQRDQKGTRRGPSPPPFLFVYLFFQSSFHLSGTRENKNPWPR